MSKIVGESRMRDNGSLDAMQECLRLAAAREEGRRGECLGATLPARACRQRVSLKSVNE